MSVADVSVNDIKQFIWRFVMKKIVIAVALLAATSGCALIGLGGPPSPEGHWNLVTEANGQPVGGSIEISRNNDGTFGGVVKTDVLPDLRITEVIWQEVAWLIRARGPEAPVEITFVRDGDQISGSWTYGPTGGDFTGSRIE